MTDDTEHHNAKIIERRRKELIIEASGKGGYIWNNKQLHNAMLWFTSDDHNDNANSKNRSEQCSNNREDLKLFIESLLRNPGILCSRPLLIGKKRRRHNDRPQGPLLPHILSSLLQEAHTKKEEGRDADKLDISLEHTIAVLSTLPNTTDMATGGGGGLQQSSSSTQQQIWDHDTKVEGKPRKLWNYFLHPSTLTKSMYATHLYSLYLEMAIQKDQGNDGQCNSIANTNIPREALLFLDQMKALAGIKHAVAEVFLLMTLEPIKRQHTIGSHWIDALSSSDKITLDIPDSDDEESRAFHILSRSVIDTVTIQNIHKFSPILLCAMGKKNFDFAKACLDTLVSCVLEIPKLVANYALQSLTSSPSCCVEDTRITEMKPHLIYDKCVIIAKEWSTEHGTMAFLLRDILNLRLMALLQSGNDDGGVQALQEFSRTMHL